MEKQLEDFIIHNWEKTELGKKYDLIIEDGEPVSQQYKTDIGSIDILATDKKTKNHVVIELKKNQTSDDTIGQLTRYMGWIMDKKGDKNVTGIVIAADYDNKLEYALKVLQNVQVFLYKVSFTLDEFKGKQIMQVNKNP
jgi:restriction system protein